MLSNPKDKYKASWEKYYLEMGDKTDGIPWDVPPNLAVILDLICMGDVYDPDLPLIDVGCGIGTQTIVLGEKFYSVYGIDISTAAISIAKKKYRGSKIQFSQMDILDIDAVKAFKQKIGDSNLYMRGMLQQMIEEDRSVFTKAIEILLGERGCLYFVEISTDAHLFFFNLHRQLRGFSPELKRILVKKVTNLVGLSKSDVDRVFSKDKFKILKTGDTSLSIKITPQHQVNVPAIYGLVSAINRP